MKKALLVFVIFIIWSQTGFATGGIVGSATGTVGQSATYTFNNGTTYTTFNWTFNNGYGTVTSSTRSGATFTLVVKWISAGTEIINFVGNGSTISSKSVVVSCPGSVATPTAGFSYPNGTTACTSLGITYSFDDNGTGLTWYWQTSSTGTSTANSTLSYTANTVGTQSYYLRAYCGGTWSTAQATASVTVNAVPTVSATGQTFCTGGTTSIVLTNNLASTLNSWTVSTSLVSGASNSSGTSGSSNPNTYTISQTLSNSSSSQGSATYTVTPSKSGCTGSAIAVTAYVNPNPTSYSVGGGGSICSGGNGSVTLSGSQSGYYYYLMPGSIEMNGTGGVLTWSGLQSAGTYTVNATTVPAGCQTTMSGSASLTVNPLPTVYTVSGGGTICAGQAGPTINLSGSQTGINYQLYVNGSPTGSAVAGTNSGLGWSNQTTGGSYTVVATNASTGCTASMSSSAAVTVNALPTQYSMGGGGAICSGASTTVTLSGSQSLSGMYYQLQINGSNSGSAQPGTGSPLSWTGQTSSGTYTVIATYSVTGCLQSMAGSASISINSLPTVYSLNVGNFCMGSTATVSLTGSQSGVNYQLQINSSNIGSPISGTGSALPFPNQSSAGSYQVVATNPSTGCTSNSPGSPVIVTALPLPTASVSGAVSACSGATMPSITFTFTGTTPFNFSYSNGTTTTPVAGWGSLTYPLSNPAPGTYSVTSLQHANGCYATSLGASATATSLPLPTAAASNQNIFSSQATSVSITNPNNVSGTTFSWIATPVNLSGASNGNGSSISQTLTNTTGGNGTATYLVTPAANGCTGNTISVLVTSYPFPSITSPQTYVAKSANVILDGGAGFNTYSWTNSVGAPPGSSQTYTANIPGTYSVAVTKSGASATTSFILNSQFSGLNMNYITTNTVLTSNITDSTTLDNLSVGQVNQGIAYFDGLGRPLQSVTTQGSPLMSDLATPVVYDSYGRETKKYLPISNENTGRYKNWLLDANGNYTDTRLNYSNGGSDKVVDDTRPFSETIFETSPLNRPINSYGPGSAWGPSANNKPVSFQYLINVHNVGTSTTQEKVIAWIVDPSTGMPLRANPLTGFVETGGYLSSNQLSLKVTVDEQGNAVREYTNKVGQVILKKVQAVTNSSSLNSPTDWALTYYIYDDVGNLRYVFQPELSKKLHAGLDSYLVTTTDLNNFAFQYNYDSRRRMSTKQVPGAGAVYMVYDLRNRLILTQDAILRLTNRWQFTKYDLLDRPILTGIRDTSLVLTQVAMQTVVNAHFAKSSAAWGESYVGLVAGNVHSYSNKAYPVRTGSVTGEIDPYKYLSATYYDNYTFRNDWQGVYAYKNEWQSQIVNLVTYSQPVTENTRVIGQVTGTKVKVLDGGVTGGYTWLKSINYYDDKYRVVQVLSDNYKSGIDRVTNVYDFAGRVLKTKSTHSSSDITWIAPGGVSLIGNRLTRILTGSGWNAGAASQQQLAANQSCWLEVTYSENTSARMVGLAIANPDLGYTSIDYALYLNAGNFKIYESGAQKYDGGGAVSGEIFRVERNGTTITYKRNGAVVYTSATASSSALMVDASIGTYNVAPELSGSLVGVRTSFSTSTDSVIRRFDYDPMGRLLRTWHRLDTQPEILLTHNDYNELGQLVDKKLHSTVSAATNARQSLDYRYNIRGWLTKINESSIDVGTADPSNAGEARDYYGLELGYNADIGVANSFFYNGNISAMKWSKNMSVGAVKDNAYVYAYDPMNRISSATFKVDSASWSVPTHSGFSEGNYAYDLNGNITGLQRYDKRGSTTPLDNLTYSYGATPGNQLFGVADSGDKFMGFVDGTNAGDDYTYDANGNMITDQNKGITTAIVYNYLNLPQIVTRGGAGGNFAQYIYDASGRKLSQVVTFSGSQKQTDYSGEYQYENNVLQSISHEEGRIMIAKTTTIFVDDASATPNFTASNSTLSSVTQNTNTYVKVISSGTVQYTGAFPIGGTIPVVAGERYKIRTRGYRDKGTAANSSAAYIHIKTAGTDQGWPGAMLPASLTTATTETWIEQIVTIPAGATTLQAGVTWNTVLSGEAIYINDFEVTKLETLTPEYQYSLKDHLGNVRATFGTQRIQNIYSAGFEDANIATESAVFSPSYANAVKVNSTLYNHTPGGSKSQRLSAANQNEIIGLTKSFKVGQGDTLDIEVYTKYIAPTSTGTNVAGLILASMGSAFGVSAASGGDGLQLYQSLSSLNGAGALITSGSGVSDAVPHAFLNYILFDQNYVAYDFGFTQITSAAFENGTGVPHVKLSLQARPAKTGFAYIYVSNENTVVAEVYFDDLKITHTKSPLIQSDDYYPFGATFNSYSRENSVPQKHFYNGKEYQDDLNLNLYDVHARQYDPWTLRTTTLDPHADRYYSLSSYSWCANNPVLNIDPTGKDVSFDITRNKKGEITGVALRSTIVITGEGASEERAGELNKASAGTFQGRTLKNGVKVSFDIKYQYKKDFDAKDLKAGDNLLSFVNKPSVENSDQAKRDVSQITNGGKLFSNKPVLYTAGNTGEIYKDDWNNNHSIFHESLHFTGLSDRYNSATGPDIGFSNDIMGSNSSKIGYDHYQAFYNVANEMPSWYPPYQKSFVNGRAVDRDYSTGEPLPPSQQQLSEQER